MGRLYYFIVTKVIIIIMIPIKVTIIIILRMQRFRQKSAKVAGCY